MTREELIESLRALQKLGKVNTSVNIAALLKILEQQPDIIVYRPTTPVPRSVVGDGGFFNDGME